MRSASASLPMPRAAVDEQRVREALEARSQRIEDRLVPGMHQGPRITSLPGAR